MRLGINGTGLVQQASVQAVADHAEHPTGGFRRLMMVFAHYWLAEHPTGGFDAMRVSALGAGRMEPKNNISGSCITSHPASNWARRSYPPFPGWRHPMAMATAHPRLTASNALQGRFTLGIGLSHEPMMAQLGIAFDRPIRHLREYLGVLMPLLKGGEVDFQESFSVPMPGFFKRQKIR